MNTSFSLGNTLATGFRVWAKNFIPFTLLALMVYSPLIIWGGLAVGGDPERVGYIQGLVRFELYSTYLVIPLSILLSAAVTYGTVMTLQGQGATLGSCIAVGLRRFFPAVGTMICMLLCFFGVAIVAGIPVGLVAGIMGQTGGVIGSLFVVVIMLWLYSILFVSIQACVIERPGPAAALGRSRDLTMGHRFAIAVLFILQGLVYVGFQMLIQSATLSSGAYKTYIYAGLARSVLISSIGAVMVAVAYSLLRGEKDGTSADELAQVFG